MSDCQLGHIWELMFVLFWGRAILIPTVLYNLSNTFRGCLHTTSLRMHTVDAFVCLGSMIDSSSGSRGEVLHWRGGSGSQTSGWKPRYTSITHTLSQFRCMGVRHGPPQSICTLILHEYVGEEDLEVKHQAGNQDTPLSDIHCPSFDVSALSSWCIWHMGCT